MLPGQWGLLLIGIVSAIALVVMGIFSYNAYDKEKRKKEKEARAKRREQWHESLKATDEDYLDIPAESAEASDDATETQSQWKEIVAEDEYVQDFDPSFKAPEAAEQQDEVTDMPTITFEPAPVKTEPKPTPVKAPEKPKSTRNDFNFKF